MKKNIGIYLIRHGRQNSRLCNVNVPLDEAGIRQSELLGKRVETMNIGVVYSSDLTRAVETAGIVNQFTKVSHHIYTELREIDFGDLTGLEESVIKEKYAEFLKERDKYEEDIHFPGGENGKQVFTRAFAAIEDIVDKAVKNDIENVLIVTHGGTIRSLIAGVLGLPQEKRLLFAKNFENTSITKLNYETESQRYYVEQINDYAHLEKEEWLLRKNLK